MAESKKILYVCSEMSPFLPETKIGNICMNLPQGLQERKCEIRTFMPRYGCINERKNQLHEVIRLSGMNLIISDVDHPLIIKVASIAATRAQVYFIDNDDYFRRKSTFADASGNFYEDNDERAIFFARGVLETVKKLRWAPDIIHCHGWIASLVPILLKKAFREDPIFSNCKVVVSLYDDIPQENFDKAIANKLQFGEITSKDTSLLEDPNGTNLVKTAARFADGVILASDNLPALLVNYCRDRGIPVLKYRAKGFEDGSYIDEYLTFYNQI